MSGPVPKRSSQRRRRNVSEPVTAVKSGPVTAAGGEPPRQGRGSSTAAWREFAELVGVQVPAGASRAEIIAAVDARGAEWEPLAREWYESLAGSAQSQFYEPSDWATAKVGAELLSAALVSVREGRRGGASMVERWQALATELLTTEGARRRARVEIERVTDDEGAAGDVSDMDRWRRRREGGRAG